LDTVAPMHDFIFSGHAVDVVLLVILIEFVVLVALRRGHRKRAAVDLLFSLTPGAMLLLALRLALVGADWQWIALAIAASFPFHLVDLFRRHKGELDEPK
jgi:hypothetical protein